LEPIVGVFPIELYSERHLKFFLILSLLLPTLAHTHEDHLPLELSFQESQELWQRHLERSNLKNLKSKTDPSVAKAIAGGELLNIWLKKINSNRRSDNQLRLRSRSTGGTVGIPIDKPMKYGPSTIKAKLEKIIAEAPKEIIEVVYNGKPMTQTNPVKDEDFSHFGAQISNAYQIAVRWETVINRRLSHYKARKKRDVRGFYYLSKEENLDQKLKAFSSLSAKDQERIKGHLHTICLNDSLIKANCSKKLKKAIKKNKVLDFKNKYWNGAIKNWNSFWIIKRPRKDVVWNSSAPNSMKVVFKDPKDSKIANWLKENIEDEFKTDTWQMEFNFKEDGSGLAYIKFKPGVTPHVSMGNIIVMDANAPIDRESVKWTIRHEYGHILRMPDCYFEFYDEEEGLAVNYQLDVTDLMCSRSGKMNERIYKELKRVYYKK
tara:strand:- start:14913 stop:16211 length:1299 start_codon:yes stop_codon:yes gene_type:complete